MKKYFFNLLTILTTLFVLNGCSKDLSDTNSIKLDGELNMNDTIETATFGAGCFWCVEAIFERLNGVIKVESGYMGGNVPNPTYEQVCTGNTGHAEVCNVYFDPNKISFADLLEVFFKTHDPTTLNRQGADIGTQYRSAIFYHSESQQALSERVIKELNASEMIGNKIVTEVSPASQFYIAEDYHQDYFNNNTGQGYCQLVIKPKVNKFMKEFFSKLKPEVK